MLIVIAFCVALIALTPIIHYEVLGILNARLPVLTIPKRSKLLVVIFTTFIAHVLEMLMYGMALFMLVKYIGTGSLTGSSMFSLMNCLYFSAESQKPIPHWALVT